MSREWKSQDQAKHFTFSTSYMKPITDFLGVYPSSIDNAHKANNCITISSSQALRPQFHRTIHFMCAVSKCLPSTQVLGTASLQRGVGVAPEVRGREEVSKIHTFRSHCPTVLGLKIPLFWDMTPCSLINIYRRVGEIFHLRL
jgi:hypothetical protein